MTSHHCEITHYDLMDVRRDAERMVDDVGDRVERRVGDLRYELKQVIDDLSRQLQTQKDSILLLRAEVNELEVRIEKLEARESIVGPDTEDDPRRCLCACVHCHIQGAHLTGECYENEQL